MNTQMVKNCPSCIRSQGDTARAEERAGGGGPDRVEEMDDMEVEEDVDDEKRSY